MLSLSSAATFDSKTSIEWFRREADMEKSAEMNEALQGAAMVEVPVVLEVGRLP